MTDHPSPHQRPALWRQKAKPRLGPSHWVDPLASTILLPVHKLQSVFLFESNTAEGSTDSHQSVCEGTNNADAPSSPEVEGGSPPLRRLRQIPQQLVDCFSYVSIPLERLELCLANSFGRPTGEEESFASAASSSNEQQSTSRRVEDSRGTFFMSAAPNLLSSGRFNYHTASSSSIYSDALQNAASNLWEWLFLNQPAPLWTAAAGLALVAVCPLTLLSIPILAVVYVIRTLVEAVAHPFVSMNRAQLYFSWMVQQIKIWCHRFGQGRGRLPVLLAAGAVVREYEKGRGSGTTNSSGSWYAGLRRSQRDRSAAADS